MTPIMASLPPSKCIERISVPSVFLYRPCVIFAALADSVARGCHSGAPLPLREGVQQQIQALSETAIWGSEAALENRKLARFYHGSKYSWLPLSRGFDWDWQLWLARAANSVSDTDHELHGGFD